MAVVLGPGGTGAEKKERALLFTPSVGVFSSQPSLFGIIHNIIGHCGKIILHGPNYAVMR